MLLRTGHLAVLHDTEGGHAAPDASAETTPDTGTTAPDGDPALDAGDTAKTYTQEQVDALLLQKLRGSGSALKDAETKLAAFEAAEAKRKEADEKRKLAEMSEIEKAQELARAATERAEAAEAARAATEQKMKAARIEAKIKGIIDPHRPNDPDVMKLIPDACKEVDENEEFTAEAIAAQDAWIKSKTGTLLGGPSGSSGPASTARRWGEQKERADGINRELIDMRNKRKTAR